MGNEGKFTAPWPSSQIHRSRRRGRTSQIPYSVQEQNRTRPASPWGCCVWSHVGTAIREEKRKGGHTVLRLLLSLTSFLFVAILLPCTRDMWRARCPPGPVPIWASSLTHPVSSSYSIPRPSGPQQHLPHRAESLAGHMPCSPPERALPLCCGFRQDAHENLGVHHSHQWASSTPFPAISRWLFSSRTSPLRLALL